MSAVSSLPLGEVILRPSQCRPEHSEGIGTISTNPYHRINFKHPSYPSEYDTFLTLPANDHPNGGLHYNTAKIACGIVANNRWDGHFTVEKNGEALIMTGDDILPCGSYYFVLPDCSHDKIETSYPITPNFTEWRFPHCHLPRNWQRPSEVIPDYPVKTRSDASVAVKLRDGDQCRVSGRKEQLEVAHIIPLKEEDWFRNNDMYRYVFDPMRQSQSAMSDINNLMLLRTDIHRSFDAEKKFVFCPKKPQPRASNMVVHLTSYSEEYSCLYQNTVAYSLDPISREYLFARFAWSILPKVEPFLLRNVERLLITVIKGQQFFTPDECKSFTVARGKRSGTGSPKKRQRSATSGEYQDVESFEQEQSDQYENRFKRVKLLPESHNSSIDAPFFLSNSLATNDDHLPEWRHFYNLREEALRKEREKSDEDGQWLKKSKWAKDTLLKSIRTNDVLRPDVNEAHCILGEVDDSRDWVQEEYSQ